MAKYVYPAVFTPEEEGKYSVFFPDLEGCYTCGDNLQDAIAMAEDVLAFYLYDEETAQNKIPEASNLSEIEKNDEEFVNYIACDTIEYAKMHNNRAIKKTLTIPEWLNEAATRAGVNYSQVLQEALMTKLNISR
ncbi:MAG: type II toxin-antitoxin system HicB family antitoxin [Faecalimonas umbilicata]|uniref:type II toxin-antitoxin system HicB family antitoxin n=1 Tax=Faecalimonas umbilicata TaxID=1912855 RepID=UPI003993BA22